MNKNNLSKILEQYVLNFDILNRSVEEGGHDEGYKWRVLNSFADNWDIDAEDFPAMFQAATSEISKTNLINNATLQPLSGISRILKEEGEIEFVREEFRKLFSEDGGGIDARGERVFAFTDALNAKLSEYFPGKWKYEQNRNAVIYYLNLWKPDDNYIFKATEAREWADCIEFADDFGSGASFKLSKYYRMCDELLAALEEYPEVLELHQKRFDKEARSFDDERHLLVFDIIFTSHYKNFYRECPSLGVSSKERVRLAKIRERSEELEKEIATLQDEIAAIEESRGELPDVTGMKVSHKTYGDGTVKSFDGSYMIIVFEAKEAKFNIDSVINGFIFFDDEMVTNTFKEYGDCGKKIKLASGKLSKVVREYEGL